MEASLPFEPKWTKQWIETKLKRNYFKKPYDRFMWWRSYTPKNKPLGNKASLIDRLINGDFDPGPYLLEVELVYHTMNEKFKELICSDGQVDFGKYTAETSIDRARKKRLEEDHEKEELRKLTDLRNLFKKQFRLSDDEYENEITKGSDTLVDFYYKLDDKYSKRNIRK
jgi:hypothetical protein